MALPRLWSFQLQLQLNQPADRTANIKHEPVSFVLVRALRAQPEQVLLLQF